MEPDDELRAFPMPDGGWEGMTLRDYFAGNAMQGFCSHHATEITPDSVDDHAFIAYMLADAMIKARLK